MALNNVVFPQSGDPNYAENFAQLIGQSDLSNFVEYGLNFTVDYAAPSVEVSEGVCFVYSSTGSTSGGDSLSGQNYVTQLASTTVSLTDGDVNHIYVNPNVGTDDSPSIEAVLSEGNAPSTSVKIGEVDTTNDTSTEVNREHTLAARLKDWVNSNADVPNADHADTAGDADTVDGKDADEFAHADGDIYVTPQGDSDPTQEEGDLWFEY